MAQTSRKWGNSMSIVSAEMIQLGAVVTSKEEAIRMAGALLVKGGCVEPEYVDGMLGREAVMSTYLGNGVAIPHGQFENLSLIHRTGVSVLQVPAGILWEDDEAAHLILGIAAIEGQHMSVLQNLAEVIEEEEIVELLVNTKDPAVIMDYLTRPVSEDDDEFDDDEFDAFDDEEE